MKKAVIALLAASLMLSAASLVSFAEEPAAKPVAWYDFEDSENPGKDKSGNGNDLIVFGEPEQVGNGPSGKAVYFDGNSALYAKTDKKGGLGSDFVDVIADSGSKKLTIAFWIRNEVSDYDNFDLATWRRIISNGHDGGAVQNDRDNKAFGGFTMLSLCDNYIVPTVVNPAIMVDRAERHDGSCIGNNAVYPYAEGKWSFVVWTADATTGQFCFYVNGAKLYDQTVDPAESGGIRLSNTARPFCIASNINYSEADDVMQLNHTYTGALDEVMVFDRIISESDVAYYMNATGADLPESGSSGEVPTEPPVTSAEPKDTSDAPESGNTKPTSTDKATEKPADTKAADEKNGGVPVGLIIGIVAVVIVAVVVAAVIVSKKPKAKKES